MEGDPGAPRPTATPLATPTCHARLAARAAHPLTCPAAHLSGTGAPAQLAARRFPRPHAHIAPLAFAWQCKTQPPYCGRGPLQLTGATNYNFCATQPTCGCPTVSTQIESAAQNANVGFGAAACIWGALCACPLKPQGRQFAQRLVSPSLHSLPAAQLRFESLAVGRRITHRFLEDVLQHSPGALPVRKPGSVRTTGGVLEEGFYLPRRRPLPRQPVSSHFPPLGLERFGRRRRKTNARKPMVCRPANHTGTPFRLMSCGFPVYLTFF